MIEAFKDVEDARVLAQAIVDTVREPLLVLDGDLRVFESQLSRMNCQIFSTGFNSGDFGGNGATVMLPGTGSLFETCHPA